MLERLPYSGALMDELFRSNPTWADLGGQFADEDILDCRLRQMKLLQRCLRTDNDGVYGPETHRLFEAYKLVYGPLMGHDINDDEDKPAVRETQPWHQRLQSAIYTLTSGRVGYATPTEKDAKNLAEPLAKRYEAEYMRPDERKKAQANGYTTTHTVGGCGSLAERLLALLLGDPTPHYCANQTAPWIPPADRSEKFKGINDNTPGAMLNGVRKIKADGWAPVCEGYAFALEYMRLSHSEIPAAMMQLKAPFAVVHQPSGHVTTAVLSDPHMMLRSNCQWHTFKYDIIPAGVLRLAADGSKARIGQPTTCCFWHAYPAFTGKAHVFFVMRPDALPDADPTLRMRLEE